MGLARSASRANESRIQVLPTEIKGLISRKAESALPFIVWDVSANGLGLLLSDRLIPGEVHQIDIQVPCSIIISCSVVWCELQAPDYDFQEPSFRCGLITVGPHNALEQFVASIEKAKKR